MKIQLFAPTLLAILLSHLAHAEDKTPSLQESAQSLINTFDGTQQKKGLFPFQDDERENWHYVPMERPGVRIDTLNGSQVKLLNQLLDTSLSAQGRTTSKEVIQLETLLYERSDKSEFRNPGKYTVAFFGQPSADKPWGWRFEGHHLSLNFTIASEKVTLTTPFFFGTNPAEVREGELKGLRPLGKIEDAARKLATTLHGEGLHVRYTNKAPKEILTGQDRNAKVLPKEGVSYQELKEEHQKEFLALVTLIAAQQRPDFLSPTPEDLADSHFAWAGEFEVGEGHYFRIQTPAFLIEYANTQNQANHAHLVWRDFDNDFGRDLLKEHLEHEH